jgi:hypothetical protein
MGQNCGKVSFSRSDWLTGVEQEAEIMEMSLNWKVEMVITWKHGSGKIV